MAIGQPVLVSARSMTD